MTQFKSLFSLKLISTLIGMSSVLASLPALAGESSSFTTSNRVDTRIAQVEETQVQKEELSPGVMRVLCNNFPLNSRCTRTSQSDSVPPPPESSSDPDPEGAADNPEMVEPENLDPNDSTDPSMDSTDTVPEQPPVDGSKDSSCSDDMDAPDEGVNSPNTIPPENTAPEDLITPDDTQGPPVSPPMVPVPEDGTE